MARKASAKSRSALEAEALADAEVGEPAPVPPSTYEIAIREDVARAIENKDWDEVFRLKAKPRPAVDKKARNDYGAIGDVVTWDDPCQRCGTKAFLNTTDGLGCLGCGLRQ